MIETQNMTSHDITFRESFFAQNMKSLSNVTRGYPQGLRKDVGDIILVLPTDAKSQHQVAYKLQYSNYKQLKDLKVKHIFIHCVYVKLLRQNDWKRKFHRGPQLLSAHWIQVQLGQGLTTANPMSDVGLRTFRSFMMQ